MLPGLKAGAFYPSRLDEGNKSTDINNTAADAYRVISRIGLSPMEDSVRKPSVHMDSYLKLSCTPSYRKNILS